MFPELNNLIDVSQEAFPADKFMLVGEGDADASFVISHMLSLYLKSRQRVCLLALSQTFTHYKAICNKLGVDLGKCREERLVDFITGINTLGERLVEEPTVDQTPHANSNSLLSLTALYHQIKDSIEKLINSENTLLIVDDISVFVSLGVPHRDVLFFIKYLKHYIEEIGGCLVVLTHHQKNADDEELELLWRELYYHCDIGISCKGLNSGYSHEVHGQMIIHKKKPTQSQIGPGQKRTMQFKISDKNVTFFAPGMSSAVL